MAVFTAVTARSTYEETVARLETAIRIGVLPAGSRLPPERILAEQLQISRSTLRHALGTLVQSGHLVAHRGRSGGTFVAADPPLENGHVAARGAHTADLVEWRTALEVGAARIAAERADAEHVDRLAEAIETQEAAGNRRAAFRRADVAFHLALAEATGSPRVVSAMMVLHGEIFDRLAAQAVRPEHRRQAVADHRRILEAVDRRDPAAAAEAMGSHVAASARLLTGRAQDSTDVS